MMTVRPNDREDPGCAKRAPARVVYVDMLKGKDAYETAVEHGFDGTEEEWLYSLGVHITSIEESTEDGGYSIITFTDGNVLRIKNGSKLTPEDQQTIVDDAVDALKDELSPLAMSGNYEDINGRLIIDTGGQEGSEEDDPETLVITFGN